MTDLIKPELIWIEGRCYRINDSNTNITSQLEHNLYEDQDDNECGDYEDNIDDIEVVSFGENRFKTSVHIPKPYQGALIGKRGVTVQRIKHDTGCDIKVPKPNENGDVVITGFSVGNVKAACRRINMIVTSTRMKQRPTHFISIPVVSESIAKNYDIFKETVLKEFPGQGIDEDVFQPKAKLHLTIAVMTLMDEEERQTAAKLLAEARDNVLVPLLRDHKPLKLRFKGVSYMNDDPKSVHVLYGLVQEENAPNGLLQEIANELTNYFYKTGLIDRKRNPEIVKLHVTLMNSRHRLEENENPSYKNRISFDASGILEKFAEYDFGSFELNDIHLSQMHNKSDDIYYPSTCVITV